VGKLIFWFIIVLVVLTIARIAARAAANRSGQDRPRPRTGGRSQRTRAVPAEQMVRCAHCGIHLPRSEATLIDGRTWCSHEHARLGERRE
jgi:uncharacterized protein